jgi:hypothetical protein
MPLIFYDPVWFVLAALLNPAVLYVAWVMGGRADQWQKLPIAGFAAALAGMVLVWIAARFGIGGFPQLGRAAAGLFIAQGVVGTALAAIAYGRAPK